MKELTVGTINTIPKSQVIYKEGQKIQSVALLIKGNVQISNAAFHMQVGPGTVIGVMDLYTEKYINTYKTVGECTLFVYEAYSIEDIQQLLQYNQENKGYMIKSLNTCLSTMYDEYVGMKNTTDTVYEAIVTIMKRYEAIKATYQLTTMFEHGFPELEQYEKPYPMKEEWILSIKELRNVPFEVITTYYSYLPNSLKKEMNEKIKLATIMMDHVKSRYGYLLHLYHTLFHEYLGCIFTVLCSDIKKLAPSHASYEELIQLVNDVIAVLNQMEVAHKEVFGKLAGQNRAAIEKQYQEMLSENSEAAGSQEEELDDVAYVAQLQDSVAQILRYGQVDQVTGQRFMELLRQFAQLKDKFDFSEETRQLRKEITSIFFFVYKKVFLQAYHTRSYPKAVELFLHFGFLEETLLTEEQLVQLSKLKVSHTVTHYCHYYTMYDWLVQIYEGKKEPSKNERDQEYREVVRTLKVEGKITEVEEKAYLEDKSMKLDYEINHLFLNNMKLTNGNIRAFVPFLFEEGLPKNVAHYFVSPHAIDMVVREILAIDFSVFYQEVLYSNPALNIPRELVLEQHLPDIILFPNSGVRGVMWQDIENRKRASSARFCLSILHEASLKDTMIYMIGRYRWEICRTQQGLAWNDITNKCLTSEYSDYIQFYRKNKDLSEERKDKIKQQLIKARNNTKECFVLDYENWIKYESQGSLRLNKVARTILATYCPFIKQVRYQLMNLPMFGESMVRYEREAASRLRVLEAKCLAIEKKSKEVPQEILHTIMYYKEK